MAALKKKNVYADVVHLGERNKIMVDKICAFLLALTPITQYYIGIVEDASITIMVVLLPWVVARMFFNLSGRRNVNYGNIPLALVMFLFMMYKTFIHEFAFANLIFNAVLTIYYFAVALGCINVKYMIEASGKIATLASILIIIQYISQYILGIHIPFAPTALFTEEGQVWTLAARTGFAGVTQRIGTLYRPSAFFMEPSHMFLYIFPHIYLLLFSSDLNKQKRNRALLYSVGITLSTSGMGVLTVALAWGLHLALSNGRRNILRLRNLLKGKNLFFVSMLAVGAIMMFIFVPFFRESIYRFLDLSDSGAIAGRTRLANALLATLKGDKLVFGVTNTTAGISFNMAGFAATLYKFGVVGIILSYAVYGYGVIKLKRQYFWIALLVIVISFFSAQTHGTFYMMYYIFILLEGNYTQRIRRMIKIA